MTLYRNNEFIFDALSEDCPIEINWAEWLEALGGNSKFAARNAVFKVKPHGYWQLRALVLEKKNHKLTETMKILEARSERLDKIEQALNSETA